jgi:hypothetical protein
MSREGGQERVCRYHQYACWVEPRLAEAGQKIGEDESEMFGPAAGMVIDAQDLQNPVVHSVDTVITVKGVF